MKIDNSNILEAVFESTTDGLLLVDNEGKVLKFNQRFHELWKIPQDILATNDDDKLLGFILDQLIEPQTFIEKVKELYKDQDAISHDQIQFKDGRIFERYSRPLKMGDKSVGRIWSFRDISELKKNQEIFGAITDLSPDIICIINIEGKILYISKAIERLHGFSSEELLGTQIMDRIHDTDKELVATNLKSLIDQPSVTHTIQYRYINKDGTYSWMETTCSNQIHNPLIQGIVAICRVITQRKELEQELTNALRLRDDFISIASHELKTPLSSIKLQLQLMHRTHIPERRSPETLKSTNVQNLLDQVQSLQTLIDDLLSVSKIRTGQLSIRPVKENLSSLVKATIERFSGLFQEAQSPLELSVDDNIFVECDYGRMEQVITNLISNSLKYAPGAPVFISLKGVAGFAELRIQDHGPGIATEQHKIIFDSFERANHADHVSGLGLGLFISKNIIEAHQGSVQVLSELGKGACFIVKLPLK